MIKRVISSILLFAVSLTIAVAQPSAADALTKMKSHLEGKATLSAEGVTSTALDITEAMLLITSDKKLLKQTFDLVAYYENSESYGPLFLSDETSKGLPRRSPEGKELHFAMASIQQGLIDNAYTSEKLVKFAKLLNNTKFETSAYFPGAVDAPKDPKQSYMVQINAQNRQSWGAPTSNEKSAAKRPTGCYLAPGSIARVIVPESMVDAGYTVRVGAHSWDHEKKPIMKRLDRVSIVYPILSKETVIGSPLGGGIYIEVPYLADLGVVEVEIINAVRSPYFSARSFDKTTNEEWRASERNNPGAWADFESEDFMMQVPTSWITKFDDPESLMADWDLAMAAIFELRGLDPEQFDKTMLYVQIDVQMRGTANFPGYPQSNYGYNPMAKEDGNNQHWMLRGPEYGDWSVLHELGHSILISKFRGETEALVNFMHVAVLNKKFGYDLDTAFGLSVGGKKQMSLDEVAITWLVTETFREGKEMNYSNRPGDEFKYQHRGYAKYVEVVDLFGWEALDNFWYAANVDYMGERSYYPANPNSDPVDSRILEMSRAAKADITPLIHFWGIQPVDAEALKRDIEAAGLRPSAKIYDKLQYYKGIIPKDNKEFCDHAYVAYPGGPKRSDKNNPLFGDGWYIVWMERYDASHHAKAIEALDAIIDLYFPNGRP